MSQNIKANFLDTFENEFLEQGNRKELIGRVSAVLRHDLSKPKVLKHFKSRLIRLHKAETDEGRRKIENNLEKYLNHFEENVQEYKNILAEIKLASSINLEYSKDETKQETKIKKAEKDLELETKQATGELRKEGAKLGYPYLGEKMSAIAKSITTIYNIVTNGREAPLEEPQRQDRARPYYKAISKLKTDVSKPFTRLFLAASRLFNCASRAARSETTVSELDRTIHISEEVYNPMTKHVTNKKATQLSR